MNRSNVACSNSKKQRTFVACQSCQNSHATCDSLRPCTRCTERGIGDSCVDAQKHMSWMAHGKRAKKRLLETALPAKSKFPSEKLRTKQTKSLPQKDDGEPPRKRPIREDDWSDSSEATGGPSSDLVSADTPTAGISLCSSLELNSELENCHNDTIDSYHSLRMEPTLFRLMYGEHIERVACFFHANQNLDAAYLNYNWCDIKLKTPGAPTSRNSNYVGHGTSKEVTWAQIGIHVENAVLR